MEFQLRKIGHVVLNVTDLERSLRFYTEVLGLQVSDRYPDTMVPGGTSLNHFAFEGRRRAGCQIALEFRDPDGNNLEIYWNIDQIGTEGAVRPASEWRQAKTLEDAVANPVKGQKP